MVPVLSAALTNSSKGTPIFAMFMGDERPGAGERLFLSLLILDDARVASYNCLMVPRITPRSNDPLEAALKKEAADLERALASDPRHQRLKIVKQALEQLRAVPSLQGTEAGKWRQAVSVMQGVRFALEDEAKPLSLAELMEFLPRYGRVPGGAKPNWNLSNQLSSSERYHSVEWGDDKRWWFKGRNLPT